MGVEHGRNLQYLSLEASLMKKLQPVEGLLMAAKAIQ